MPLHGRVDLRSDTVTQPSDAMRAAMMAAKPIVGRPRFSSEGHEGEILEGKSSTGNGNAAANGTTVVIETDSSDSDSKTLTIAQLLAEILPFESRVVRLEEASPTAVSYSDSESPAASPSLARLRRQRRNASNKDPNTSDYPSLISRDSRDTRTQSLLSRATGAFTARAATKSDKPALLLPIGNPITGSTFSSVRKFVRRSLPTEQGTRLSW